MLQCPPACCHQPKAEAAATGGDRKKICCHDEDESLCFSGCLEEHGSGDAAACLRGAQHARAVAKAPTFSPESSRRQPRDERRCRRHRIHCRLINQACTHVRCDYCRWKQPRPDVCVCVCSVYIIGFHRTYDGTYPRECDDVALHMRSPINTCSSCNRHI
ncbi:hypothetical protein ACQJBY_046507 [Aegilops geniculata]